MPAENAFKPWNRNLRKQYLESYTDVPIFVKVASVLCNTTTMKMLNSDVFWSNSG